MTLKAKHKLRKFSLAIPYALKVRIDALTVNANAAGLEFDLSAVVLSFIEAAVTRDEKALKKRVEPTPTVDAKAELQFDLPTVVAELGRSEKALKKRAQTTQNDAQPALLTRRTKGAGLSRSLVSV